MTRNKNTQETLFIDMKYIILYRKLGYKEIHPDEFTFKYEDTKITIESENQRFFFKGRWYILKSYKDMVLLECIDRLLKIGYREADLMIDNKADLLLVRNNQVFACFYVEEWGKPYFNLLNDYTHANEYTTILYTSQLSGGLIDYKAKYYSENNIFDKGLFECDTQPFKPFFSISKNSTDYNDAHFTIKNDEVVKYCGEEKKVIIPMGVSKIGMGAFWNNTIVEEVEIPNSVTCIAGDAFVYCDNLKILTIPESVKIIGDNPFAGCLKLKIECRSKEFVLEEDILFNKNKDTLIHYSPLKNNLNYRIPNSVEWIGKHSFYKCHNLKQVIISKNVEFMGNNVFSDCENIQLINESPYFDYINGVLYNKDHTQVFHYSIGSRVEDVVILEGVRTIGRNSFWNSRGISTITIPTTVRQIGYNPFAYCVNTRFINYSPFFTIVDGVLYTKNLSELICCTSIAGKNLTRLPEEVKNIGRNAFTGCEELKEVCLPESLESISRGAFSGCINLREITIPYNVKIIGDWAFNNCTGLKKIYMPHTISIEPNMFKNCSVEVVYV